MRGNERMHGEDRAVRELLESLADEPAPDLAPAVMARIHSLEAATAARPTPVGETAGTADGRDRRFHRLGAALGWLWRPRAVTIPLRPAVAMAAAAVALWLALPATFGPAGSAPAAAGAAPAYAPSVFVQFRLDAYDARDVRLAGDFTDWQPTHELRQVAPGTWTVVVPMQPGVHEYAFVVDGEHWKADPLAEHVSDGFGGVNSRLAVLVPERSEAL